jgi:hypothetical protein
VVGNEKCMLVEEKRKEKKGPDVLGKVSDILLLMAVVQAMQVMKPIMTSYDMRRLSSESLNCFEALLRMYRVVWLVTRFSSIMLSRATVLNLSVRYSSLSELS